MMLRVVCCSVECDVIVGCLLFVVSWCVLLCVC